MVYFDDVIKGPPLRPVCGAIVSSNMRISYFLSSILRPVIALSDDVCDSTDDMLSRVERCNEQDLTNCIVDSMDVDALYPSIDIEFAVEKCMELLIKSGIQFKNVDTGELGLFLMYNDSEENLQRAGLLQHCPQRKNKLGRTPLFTASGTNSSKAARWNAWKASSIKPIDATKMVVHALGITLRYTLSNHVCMFNNELFKQMKGGAIGVGIAGDAATLFMAWWDQQLKSEIPTFKMYARYVDDIDLVIEADTDDETTMARVQNVANSIHPSIQVSIDYPSKHPDGKLPVLDTKQWIEDGKLFHTYYSKPMSNKFVVMASSAISDRSKHNILVADLLRVMRCVSPQCDPIERQRHVQEFIYRMQVSGYNQEQRVLVYKAAKSKYDQQMKNHQDKVSPMYKSKQWRRAQRQHDKSAKKKNWYGDKFDAVYFVQATPGSQLANQCQKTFQRCNLSVKVIERTGRTVKQMLVKSDPLRREVCKCSVCKIAGKQICKIRDCVYEMVCSGCAKRYVGETSRSLRERYLEHMMLLESKHPASVFYRHVHDCHRDETNPIIWKIKLLSRCPGDASLRQATEATYIYETRPELNGRVEYQDNRPRQARLTSIIE